MRRRFVIYPYPHVADPCHLVPLIEIPEDGSPATGHSDFTELKKLIAEVEDTMQKEIDRTCLCHVRDGKCKVHPENKTRYCNRHSDCTVADKDYLLRHPEETRVPFSHHCHDDECEECFGN